MTVFFLNADDMGHMATSINGVNAAAKIQHTLDAIPKWLEDWRLAVIVAKAQEIPTGSVKWKLVVLS